MMEQHPSFAIFTTAAASMSYMKQMIKGTCYVTIFTQQVNKSGQAVNPLTARTANGKADSW
ncbi:hypothetical protein AA980_08300 [Neobacillus vireti]|nr:hypothetical protein AA980_08300 [Neobacillus vireti]